MLHQSEITMYRSIHGWHVLYVYTRHRVQRSLQFRTTPFDNSPNILRLAIQQDNCYILCKYPSNLVGPPSIQDHILLPEWVVLKCRGHCIYSWQKLLLVEWSRTTISHTFSANFCHANRILKANLCLILATVEPYFKTTPWIRLPQN